jgi:RNA polymerase sigma-70 factor (ECF subfamily)
MIPPHDADLIAAWQRGDPNAFAEMVRRWQQPMARFLHRLCGQPCLVPDLCQEVFLRVHLARASYRENGHFSAWLYRVALNVARDVARRRPPPTTSTLDPPGPVSAADACQREETARLVARAVSELPEPLRMVLVLRHDEGLSFEEIARLTDTPASTLKSRFAAALARLRERLVQMGLGPEEAT